MVMDCVSCEKCRLWGKIQFSGMKIFLGIGTALKILFSKANNPEVEVELRRWEIVSLVNTIGRLSESVKAAEEFDEEERNAQQIIGKPIFNIASYYQLFIAFVTTKSRLVKEILLRRFFKNPL